MKFCLRCYDAPAYGDHTFCQDCGSKLTDWDLKCECGAALYPVFTTTTYPPFRMGPSYKYCGKCGARIDKKIMNYVKILKE